MALAAPGSAAAQGPRAAAAPAGPSIIQDQNQDQPIQIESATLEVRDKNKMATFSGDVVVIQGDTTIKCQTLVVFYGAEHGPGATRPVAAAAQSGEGTTAGARAQKETPRGTQDIRRIEARGGVTITTKDQIATGDLGVYDPKKKTMTLTGNVVVSQGKNVLHGDSVVVDTVTGDTRFESGASTQNRVRALILPKKDADGGPANVLSIGPNRPN
jgi:lipopolysaccharide export system protein LptA